MQWLFLILPHVHSMRQFKGSSATTTTAGCSWCARRILEREVDSTTASPAPDNLIHCIHKFYGMELVPCGLLPTRAFGCTTHCWSYSCGLTNIGSFASLFANTSTTWGPRALLFWLIDTRLVSWPTPDGMSASPSSCRLSTASLRS